MSVEAINRFTFSVLHHLYVTENSTENFLFSGLGLYVILGAINIGLRSSNYDQLPAFFENDFEESYDNENWGNTDLAKRFQELSTNEKYQYGTRSVLFCSCYLYPVYERIIKSIFELDHTKIDLSNSNEAVTEINRQIFEGIFNVTPWNVVKESIRIKNKLHFISTINFVNDWVIKFNPSQTSSEMFYDRASNNILVETMNQFSEYHIYDPPYSSFKILFKRLKDPKLFAVIVLPKSGSSMNDALKDIKFDKMHIYFKDSEEKLVHLILPKFKILTSYNFGSTMKKLEITDIFHSQYSDFGKMTNSSVSIGSLIQVARFSVDENGVNTEDEEGLIGSTHQHMNNFRVNNPFLFLIYSNSDKLVHLSAIINNPNAA
ncbi:Leukocyte elastase inhibitor [Thelohanellus kitauei]|uniref:Leukocyte elastase inhibitor n=1 Tax=Thelohanellus kitauei TaxID=669202 RepID=A0A0C2J4Y2_THEKT|nr:Leukocyte elastase inhibitor [Thelohanellus kitauei]KII75049.1 Leukocyte elastase inhibitor [Thelohanellus kitauei]